LKQRIKLKAHLNIFPQHRCLTISVSLCSLMMMMTMMAMLVFNGKK